MEKIQAGDIVEVSRPNDPNYEPWIGRVYYHPFNQGLAVESFKETMMLKGDYDNPNPTMSLELDDGSNIPLKMGMGKERYSKEKELSTWGTVWKKLEIPNAW